MFFRTAVTDVWLGWEITPTESDHSSSEVDEDMERALMWQDGSDGDASSFKSSSKNQLVVIGTMLFFQ